MDIRRRMINTPPPSAEIGTFIFKDCNGVETEHQFEIGMTWADFYCSKYNSFIDEGLNPPKSVVYNLPNYNIAIGMDHLTTDTNVLVKFGDEIINCGYYTNT